MKSKQLMLFAVAIGCGLVAMVGAQQILSGNKQPEQELVRILVAKIDINPGVPLDESNVGFKNWPKDNVLEGAIVSKEEFAERTLKIRVSPNMPILQQYLGPIGADGIRSQISKDQVLITLPVDSTQTHSGLLRPGAYVSVTCAITRPSRDGRGESTSIKTVLNRVKVAAVGDRIAGSENAKEAGTGKIENISFLTRPRQAKLLNLARIVSKERLQFAMLGEEDRSIDESEDLNEADLAQRTSDLLGEKSEENRENPLANVDPESKQRPTGSSFTEYLKQQPVAQEVVELGSQPLKPTWRIEIVSGDKKKLVQLHELPEDEVEAVPTMQVPESSENWAAPILKFFTRKRVPKADQNQVLSPSVDEAQTGTTNEKSAAKPIETSRQ